MSAVLIITFMDDSRAKLTFGRHNDSDNYSWTPRQSGLVVRHSRGHRTIFPWTNIKFYSVVVDDEYSAGKHTAVDDDDDDDDDELEEP